MVVTASMPKDCVLFKVLQMSIWAAYFPLKDGSTIIVNSISSAKLTNAYPPAAGCLQKVILLFLHINNLMSILSRHGSFQQFDVILNDTGLKCLEFSLSLNSALNFYSGNNCN